MLVRRTKIFTDIKSGGDTRRVRVSIQISQRREQQSGMHTAGGPLTTRPFVDRYQKRHTTAAEPKLGTQLLPFPDLVVAQ